MVNFIHVVKVIELQCTRLAMLINMQRKAVLDGITAMASKRKLETSVMVEKHADSSIRETRGIVCQEAPCDYVYVPIEKIQDHMRQYHEYVCEDCMKNLVNERLLQLHLTELHDPFLSASTLRYGCFEESCIERFDSHIDRIAHLKYAHGYPDDFDFNVVQSGRSFD